MIEKLEDGRPCIPYGPLVSDFSSPPDFYGEILAWCEEAMPGRYSPVLIKVELSIDATLLSIVHSRATAFEDLSDAIHFLLRWSDELHAPAGH